MDSGWREACFWARTGADLCGSICSGGLWAGRFGYDLSFLPSLPSDATEESFLDMFSTCDIPADLVDGCPHTDQLRTVKDCFPQSI